MDDTRGLPSTGPEATGSPRSTADAGTSAIPPLDRSLGYHLRQLSESWSGLMHRIIDNYGVTQGQWRYLRELWEEDGLSQRELSQRVDRQGPTTVAALRLLERSGLASVERSEHDRRKTRVQLTERGRELAAELGPVVGQVQEIGMAGFDEDEIKAFKRFIVRIQGNIDAHSKTRNPWSSWRTQRLAEELDE